MFWGLIMEPQKRYSQSVKKSFHISHAAMDTATGDNGPCQVMVVVDGQNFLICTLQKGKTIQTSLDLYFREGEAISFITNGKCHIHLTGYLDLDYEDLAEEDDEDEDEEQEQENGVEDEVPELVPAKSKRKRDVSPDPKNLSKKQKKELKKKKELEMKKAGSEEDSSDAESLDIQKLLEEEDTDEADDSYMPNDQSMEKLEEDSDEEDEDEEEEEESESEESGRESSPASGKRSKQQQQQQPGKTTPQLNGHSQKTKNKENEKVSDTPQKEKKVLAGNVAIEDLKVGTGAVAKPGKMIQVLYEGRLKSNNKMFDSCQKGPGFKFRLGKSEVIKGWDVGVAGMRIGGRRRIVCPPAMAYGNKGSPPLIPANSTLVFEVELKGVN